MELKNKTVIITGGTKGLGKALALSFLKENSHVVICARNEEELLKTPEGILGIKADVTKEKDLERVMKITKEEFGQVDIWINNAGIWLPHAFAENFDMEKVRKMFDVNVFGLMEGSRIALREMKEKKSGMIINIISNSALLGRPISSMYCASKWAVNGFAKSIREENDNISILSIYPGAMKTDIFYPIKFDDFNDFMEPEYVAEKIVSNVKKENPEEELLIEK